MSFCGLLGVFSLTRAAASLFCRRGASTKVLSGTISELGLEAKEDFMHLGLIPQPYFLGGGLNQLNRSQGKPFTISPLRGANKMLVCEAKNYLLPFTLTKCIESPKQELARNESFKVFKLTSKIAFVYSFSSPLGSFFSSPFTFF